LNNSVIGIYRFQPYLVVAVFEEVGVQGKKDYMNRVFSMGILGGHRKVPIGWLQRGFLRPFGAFLDFVIKLDFPKINLPAKFLIAKPERRKGTCLSRKSSE